MDIQKIKLLVQDQFPEFYREEYPQLVNFITQYYSYLGTTNYSTFQNIRDVDSTLERFVYNLKQDFATNVPEFGKLSDRDFLKFAREFYASRGSEDSYRFLFRAMYGKEIDVFYPSTLILKASDGTWEQEVSIRATSTDDLLTLTGNTFELTDSNAITRGVNCLKVVRVTATIYDIYIDRYYKGPISSGDALTFGTKTGTIVNVPSKIEIVYGGVGFIAGSVYDVAGTKPLRFKIGAVGNGGNILSAQIIQPGDDTITEVYIAVSADTRVAVSSNPILNPAQDYADPTYFLETDAFQYAVGSDFQAETGDAVLRIVPDSRLKYPGFYSSSKGFLSDAVRLQDNEYYQAYSYVLRLDEQLESYKAVVKRLLHPSGMALWAQYDISAEADSAVSVQAIYDAFKVGVEDDVLPSDSNEKTFMKSLETPQVITDFSRLAFLKPLEHTADALDQFEVELTKPFADTATASDSGRISQLVFSEYAFDYFSEDYIDLTVPTENILQTW